MEVFECIPSDVLCTSDDRHGNFLLAQRTFRPGDIILSSEPFAFALLDHCIKTRCSYCCAKSTALLQCSRCRYTLYCDAHCQKKGWAFHKSECTALSLCLQSAQGGEQLLADLRLVLMTEGAKKSTTHNCSRREDGVSICGGNHCSRLAIGHSFDMSTTRAAAQAIAAITKSNSNSSIDDYKCTIAKFACNNFGLLDELLGCIGAAVSPCVALLNHSCAPSCVLRFDYRRGHAPSIKVRPKSDRYEQDFLHDILLINLGCGRKDFAIWRGIDTRVH